MRRVSRDSLVGFVDDSPHSSSGPRGLTLRKVVGIGSTHHFSLQNGTFLGAFPPKSPEVPPKSLATPGRFPPNPPYGMRDTISKKPTLERPAAPGKCAREAVLGHAPIRPGSCRSADYLAQSTGVDGRASGARRPRARAAHLVSRGR